MSADEHDHTWTLEHWDPDAPGLDVEDWGLDGSWPDDLGDVPGAGRQSRSASGAVPEVLDAGFLPRDVAPPALSGLEAGPAGGFAGGNELDVMLPGVALAGFAEDVAGPDGRCAGASDDELVGVLRAWDRLESWTAARKLAVVAELIRRRPAPGCSPAGPGAMPAGWGKFCGDELAAATATSKLAADKTLTLAHDLTVRLPRTARALREGTITLYKARLIAEATRDLTAAEAAAAEALILDGAAGKTPGQLRAAIARAVVAVSPGAAAARRERAQRDARVELWREDAGTAALCGRDLPPAEALAADQAITAYARDLKAAGLDGTMDQLRARAFLDLALGVRSHPANLRDPGEPTAAPHTRDARGSGHQSSSPAEGETADDSATGTGAGADADAGADAGAGADADAGEGATGTTAGGASKGGADDPDAGDSEKSRDNGGTATGGDGKQRADPAAGTTGGNRAAGQYAGNDTSVRDATGGAGGTDSAAATRPATGTGPGTGADAGTSPGTGLAARINLTIPLATLLGLAERPGEAAGLGAIDPALARTLAASAAASPRTTWCVTVTDHDGHPTAHGCARPARGSPDRRNEPSEPSRPNGGGVPADDDGPSGRSRPSSGGVPSDRQGPIGRHRARAQGVTAFTREGDNGPPGGYGRWRLRPAGGRELLVPIEPLAVLDCDHRHESAGYQPSGKLRHLVEVRDGECDWPPCRRAARRCDFEHAVPWDQGGRTCACNAGPRCRHHHHQKQAAGWRVEQHLPGYHTWTTPAGRTYTTEPTQYPV